MAKVKNTNKNGTKKPVQEKNLKTIFWARFWWLFGGIFGAHHFYLNRYDHGLVNFLTFGGFGVGWIRDFFRLSTYVLDTNEDHEYIEWYKAQIRKFLKVKKSSCLVLMYNCEKIQITATVFGVEIFR